MKNTNQKFRLVLEFRRKALMLAAIAVFLSGAVNAQTTLFQFDAQLPNEFTPATGDFEMEFVLYDAETGGNQIGASNLINEVRVHVRALSVWLDFGAAAFNGDDRFIEIKYRHRGQGAFKTVATRWRIVSVPYAIRALNATNADNINGVDLSSFVLTTDARLSDARTPLPGSNDYVQNSMTTQAGANFNVGGTGTANVLNAATQFDLNNQRILSNAGNNNLFAGVNAGSANTVVGGLNSFFGHNAGQNNTTGFSNSFFGAHAGSANTGGTTNSFFGARAGLSNTDGDGNSFFGTAAGQMNTTGDTNSFFGANAGFSNTTGSGNSFFGRAAGRDNTTGSSLSFFGSGAGQANTTGFSNSFFGAGAGRDNTTGFSNSFFGISAGLSNTTGRGNSFFGSSSGDSNTTGSNNSFFGSSSGLANTTGIFNSFFGSLVGQANTTGFSNSFFGFNAGRDNTTGSNNSFFGVGTGGSNTTGEENAFFGLNAGSSNTTGSNNTIIGYSANVGAGNLTFAAAIGSQAIVRTSNTIVLGRENGSDLVRVFGLGAAGATQLCRNADNEISTCSSSLRYKTDVQPFTGGLDLVKRLTPITFRWRGDGRHDVGFGAEEVEKIEPLLTFKNQNGETEGVNYAQISTVLVNSVKEQQTQIEQLQEQNKQMRQQIDALKKLVCQTNAEAVLCKAENGVADRLPVRSPF